MNWIFFFFLKQCKLFCLASPHQSLSHTLITFCSDWNWLHLCGADPIFPLFPRCVSTLLWNSSGLKGWEDFSLKVKQKIKQTTKKWRDDACDRFERSSARDVETVVKRGLGECSALLTVHSCQLCTTGVPLIVRVNYCDKSWKCDLTQSLQRNSEGGNTDTRDIANAQNHVVCVSF